MKFELTDLGVNLQSSLVTGETLYFTRATGGAAYSSNPKALLSVQDKRQDIQIEDKLIDPESNKAKLLLTLSNIGLAEGYILKQIGIYAKTDTSEEILYIIGQDSRGETIPAITDKQVEFDYKLSFYYDSAYEIVVNVSESDFLKKKQFVETVAELEGKKVDASGGDISDTLSAVAEPAGTEKYPKILAAGEATKGLLGKLLRWSKSLRTDKVEVSDYEKHSHAYSAITSKPSTFPPSDHNHDSRYYTGVDMDVKLGTKVEESGGDIANTKVSGFTASKASYPVPAPGETPKVFLGKIVKFFADTRNWMTGVCLIGSLVNNCVTNRADLPLSAAQGKVLMDLYNVLNTNLTKLDNDTLKTYQVQLNGKSHFTVDGGDHVDFGLPTVGWYCVFSISSDNFVVQYAVSYTSDARFVRAGINKTSMQAWHAF